jgi:hypothetical protein
MTTSSTLPAAAAMTPPAGTPAMGGTVTIGPTPAGRTVQALLRSTYVD